MPFAPSNIVSGAVNVVSQNKGTVVWIGIGLVALALVWQIKPDTEAPMPTPMTVGCPPAPVVHAPQAQKRQVPARPQDRW